MASDTRAVGPAQRAFGMVWFVFVVAGYLAFAYLAFLFPGGLDTAWAWLHSMPIVWQVVAWIALLPWAFSLWIWSLAWPEWLAESVIVLTAVVVLVASWPRASGR